MPAAHPPGRGGAPRAAARVPGPDRAHGRVRLQDGARGRGSRDRDLQGGAGWPPRQDERVPALPPPSFPGRPGRPRRAPALAVEGRARRAALPARPGRAAVRGVPAAAALLRPPQQPQPVPQPSAALREGPAPRVGKGLTASSFAAR
ncbi:hypothetical protein FOCC_FOCC002154, partial [Frankliniella occidentalis]